MRQIVNKILVFTFLLVIAFRGECKEISSGDAIDRLSLQVAYSSAAVRGGTLQNEAEIEGMKRENRLPDPEIEFESAWNSGEAKMSGSVTQGFELPSAYKARSRAVASNMKALEYLREATMMETIMKAKRLIIDYVYQSRRLSSLREIKVNLDSLAAGIEKGYRGGELTILDLRKICVEQVSLLRDIAEVEIARSELAGRINAMADGTDTPCDFTPELEAIKDYPSMDLKTLDYYQRVALTHNPTMRLNAARTGVARDMESVAKAEMLPTFGVGYAFEREEGRLFNGFRVSMTLPLWRGSSAKKAARLEKRHAELVEESAKVSELARIKGMYEGARKGREVLSARIAALGSASGSDSWVALLKKALDVGRISVLDYLNETRFFRTALLELEDARHAQALILTELELPNVTIPQD